MNKIKISIITATFNCAEVLPCCLESMAKQTYKNREHIIIDGGSTDGTVNAINDCISNIAIFRCEPDNGIYDALNKGIGLASGDVVGFLHSDDLYASDDVLQKIAHAFEDDESLCAVYADLEYVSQACISKVIRRWKSKSFRRKDLDWGWMPPHPTLYVKRSWYMQINGFDCHYRISADYLTILKLFANPSFKSRYIPDVTIKMRLGGASNKSIDAIIIKFREDWCALRSCGYGVLGALRVIIWKNISKLAQFF